MEQKPLTIEELRERVDDVHTRFVWVKIIEKCSTYITPAILDEMMEGENKGIVAIWCADVTFKDWLIEKDYGKKWLAFSEEPLADDNYDPNIPMPHLNGIGFVPEKKPEPMTWTLGAWGSYKCPNCREYAENDDYGRPKFTHFCPNCGQRLMMPPDYFDKEKEHSNLGGSNCQEK